jgi:hypothetical protein
MAPVDPKLPWQSFPYIMQPLRGPVNVGSNIVVVNVKLDQGSRLSSVALQWLTPAAIKKFRRALCDIKTPRPKGRGVFTLE